MGLVMTTGLFILSILTIAQAEKKKRDCRSRPNGAELDRSELLQIPYNTFSLHNRSCFSCEKKKSPC